MYIEILLRYISILVHCALFYVFLIQKLPDISGETMGAKQHKLLLYAWCPSFEWLIYF